MSSERLCGGGYSKAPGKLNWHKLGWTQKETIFLTPHKSCPNFPTHPLPGTLTLLRFQALEENVFLLTFNNVC